jgi:hypothetical protein
MPITAPQDLAAGLLTGSWSIITAGAPQHAVAAKGGNDGLRRWLLLAGYRPVSLRGVYQGTPDGLSFLVPDLPPMEALELGRMYGQDAVITGGVMASCATGAGVPWTGEVLTGPEALASDYHSIVDGTDLAFSLVFDWEREVPVTAV